MKENTLFIGIGQAGGNIVRKFEEKGFFTFYINTSAEDLYTIPTSDIRKFHIPTAFGCNKDRKKALDYTKQYFSMIIDSIDRRYPLQNQVIFVFSLGGGTGSGISPIILDIISNKFPEKNFGVACVLPDKNESLKAKHNAVETYKQLSSIEGIKNIYVLDNNENEKKIVNERFSDYYNYIPEMSKPDERGIIDMAEINMLQSTKGAVYIAEIEISKENGELIYKKDPIFANHSTGCQYIAYSLKDNFSDEELKSLSKPFGTPIDTFKGFNKEKNLMLVFGLPFPTERITELNAIIKTEKDEINFGHDSLDNIEEIDIYETIKNKSKTKQMASMDIASIFDKYGK